MPGSFFHSDRDGQALNAICRAYDMTRAGDLRRSAFSRGRASSEIVYFRRRDVGAASGTTSAESNASGAPEALRGQVYLVRGGIPIHIAASSRSPSGLPLVHTKRLADSSGFQFLVSPSHRGIVVGIAILIPRVGTPKPEHLRVREILSPIQLSDCVLALCFDSMAHAAAVSKVMKRDFRGLLGCWAGTGAPYTTVSKMSDHLRQLGLECHVSSTWPLPARAAANGVSLTVDASQCQPTSSPDAAVAWIGARA